MKCVRLSRRTEILKRLFPMVLWLIAHLSSSDNVRSNFFDAMMLAAAERAGADTFLSEDLADGETYCGIKVSNPFKLAS